MRPTAIVCFFMLALLPCCLLGQQKVTLTGVVLGADSAVLADASVSLLHVADSTIAAGALTDARGKYSLPRQDTGHYILYISAVGHRPLLQPFYARPGAQPDSFYLHIQAKEEEGVTVTGLAPPVTVKKDTLEYSASAFKSRDNEVVEDLVKRMPGFKIEADGSLTYNGEKVTRILVDGKPFQIENAATLKTLPVKIIDKIQVIDERPKEDKYSKVDNGNREKVLNLTVKKDKKKGWFANISASAGTNGQRDEKLGVSRFNNKRKLHLSGGESATVQQQGGLDNRTRQLNGNFSYNDAWSPDLDFSGRTSGNRSEGNNTRRSLRQTFLQNDTVLYSRNQGASNYTNHAENGNFDVDWRPTKTSELSLEGGLNRNNSRNSSVSSTVNSNNFNQPINASVITNNSLNNSGNFNSSLSYNRQIDTNGRYLSARINFNTGTNESNGYNTSVNDFFNPDSTLKRHDEMNQYRQSQGRNLGWQLYSAYNMPVFRHFNIQANYSFNYSSNESIRNTYDFDAATGKYSTLNELQSNGFRNQSYSHRQTISISRNVQGFNTSVRLGLQQVQHVNRNFDSASSLRQQFFNITPGATINYFTKNKTYLRFNYNGNTTQPTIQQRQPVIDNSNPLYIRSGNPNLRPEYSNQFNLQYTKSNRAAGRNISVNADFSNTLNKITEVIRYDSEGKQFSRPENVNGNYRVNANTRYGFPISLKSKSYGGINLGANNSRNMGFVNGQENIGRHFNLNAGASANYNIKEYLFLNGALGFAHSESRYSTSTRNNRSFNSFTASLGADLQVPGNWRLVTNVDYNNRGSQVDFGRETTLWSLSISKLLLNKKLSLGLRVNDLLQQNVGYNRTVGANYIEEVDGSVPGRFVQFTASYNFDRFGK